MESKELTGWGGGDDCCGDGNANGTGDCVRNTTSLSNCCGQGFSCFRSDDGNIHGGGDGSGVGSGYGDDTGCGYGCGHGEAAGHDNGTGGGYD